jgi:hypothetical protein
MGRDHKQKKFASGFIAPEFSPIIDDAVEHNTNERKSTVEQQKMTDAEKAAAKKMADELKAISSVFAKLKKDAAAAGAEAQKAEK